MFVIVSSGLPKKSSTAVAASQETSPESLPPEAILRVPEIRIYLAGEAFMLIPGAMQGRPETPWSSGKNLTRPSARLEVTQH